jgi:hypothetical protein
MWALGLRRASSGNRPHGRFLGGTRGGTDKKADGERRMRTPELRARIAADEIVGGFCELLSRAERGMPAVV